MPIAVRTLEFPRGRACDKAMGSPMAWFPLAIINTSFLGDGPRLQAWIAQLIGAVTCELASATSTTLHSLLVLDDAGLLLPAGAGRPSSKEPLSELLRRASAAGLGVVLATRRPGDLDHRRCAAIDT